jgi:hypothetical protein
MARCPHISRDPSSKSCSCFETKRLGGYGYVFLAKDARDERQLYALKKLLIRNEEAERAAVSEIDVMV